MEKEKKERKRDEETKKGRDRVIDQWKKHCI